MCRKYEEYKAVTKQIAAALVRGEFDYAQELLASRPYPEVRHYEPVKNRSDYPGKSMG